MPDEATLKPDEFHPSAADAMGWLKKIIKEDPVRYINIKESIASVALSGNRLAEICNSTLDRLEKSEPVSDRYLLGLCWFLRSMIEQDQEKPKK